MDERREILNYIELIKKAFSNRKRIGVFAGTGFAIGILIAITTPKEYQSTSNVLLESDGSSSTSMGQFGALAGLAGINMSQFQSGQLALTPDIFPDVIQSRDFLRDISKVEFKFESKGGEIKTLEDYYFEEKPSNLVTKILNFILGIPSRIVGWFASPDPLPVGPTSPSFMEEVFVLNLSGKELFSIGELKKRILIEQKGKIIQLNVSMPEPYIAAHLNALVLERLIEYVTEYKVGKEKRNIEFIEERVKESEKRYADAQMRLASYRDSNQGVISQRVRTREEQLEFEFNIAYNVYNSMKQELEQATIQLKKVTPIFTVLEKPAIPLGPSKPNTPLIVIFSIFMGVFVGIIVNVYQVLLKNINRN